MSDKRYAAVKRVSLAGVSEGWDDECYALIVPTTYEDNKRVAETDFTKLPPAEQIDYQLKFVREHFIKGFIKAFDGDTFALTPMTAEDTAASVAITDYLYSEIMGFGLDPKDMRAAVAANASPTTELPVTETSSSAA